ncbi:hypothetical protein Nepgr_018485 [Nepenthes gracilis]|uniref:Uncharacterized protein n=1 Tax=Nepenthes gracilis TaxID=150966 RepID=A0AAD3STI1_NEPGR|nr:hypothetical protein Nepgr_018485 [Nepenthes gracilis]
MFVLLLLQSSASTCAPWAMAMAHYQFQQLQQQQRQRQQLIQQHLRGLQESKPFKTLHNRRRDMPESHSSIQLLFLINPTSVHPSFIFVCRQS